jgi:hypothetical protein
MFVRNEKLISGRGRDVGKSSLSGYDNGDVEKEILKESYGMRNGGM